MRPKVSVVVPFFNVEHFIERCARSLFEQTLKDLEFIFVNDCSTDNTEDILLQIIKEYPDRKNQIVIVQNKQNFGVPSSRQVGLQHVKGEYVIHCDSDDWVEKDAYEKMYDLAEENDADIVTCGYYYYKQHRRTICIPDCPDNNVDFIQHMLDYKCACTVWNKLIRHAIYLNPIEVPHNNMLEDLVLITQLCSYSKKIVHIKEALYHYFYVDNSISNSLSTSSILQRFHDRCSNILLIERFFKETPLYDQIEPSIMHCKFFQRDTIIWHFPNRRYEKLWNNTFPEINYAFLFNNKIPLFHKIRFFFLKCRIWWIFRVIILKAKKLFPVIS